MKRELRDNKLRALHCSAQPQNSLQYLEVGHLEFLVLLISNFIGFRIIISIQYHTKNTMPTLGDKLRLLNII